MEPKLTNPKSNTGSVLVIAAIIGAALVLLVIVGSMLFIFLRKPTAPTTSSPSPQTNSTDASTEAPTKANLTELEKEVGSLSIDDTTEDFTPDDTAGL